MAEEFSMDDAGNVVPAAPALGAVAVLDSVDPSSLEDDSAWPPPAPRLFPMLFVV